MPTFNLIISTFIFVCCCHELHRITNILTPVFVPNDLKCFIRNCLVYLLIIIVSSYMFASIWSRNNFVRRWTWMSKRKWTLVSFIKISVYIWSNRQIFLRTSLSIFFSWLVGYSSLSFSFFFFFSWTSCFSLFLSPGVSLSVFFLYTWQFDDRPPGVFCSFHQRFWSKFFFFNKQMRMTHKDQQMFYLIKWEAIVQDWVCWDFSRVERDELRFDAFSSFQSVTMVYRWNSFLF